MQNKSHDLCNYPDKQQALSCNPFITKSASEISNADFQLN